MFFWLFISLVIIQRLVELLVAKRNTRTMLSKGALEIDSKGYKFIVTMHSAFFVSLVVEKNISSADLNVYWLYFFLVFAAAQLLRYWAIVSLGEFWNTRIIVLKGSPRIMKGPYKYFNHPNYTAVVAEIASIPLIFSCYVTMIVFTVTNLIVLKRRVKIEEQCLNMNN